MQFKESGEWRHGNEYSTQTPKKSILFSGQCLCNRSTLDIGVLGYIGIVWPKEHSPEVWSVPPVTPCICSKRWFNLVARRKKAVGPALGYTINILYLKGHYSYKCLQPHNAYVFRVDKAHPEDKSSVFFRISQTPTPRRLRLCLLHEEKQTAGSRTRLFQFRRQKSAFPCNLFCRC